MSQERDLLLDLFGDYRSEWRRDLFGTLFTVPPYFSKLESARPCFLFGGRGTGKTTALRSLRHDATYVRLPGGGRIPYLGIYVRLNKNRVRAFEGAARNSASWNKAFAHYFNLLAVLEFTQLHQWLCTNERWPTPTATDLQPVASTFGVTAPSSLQEFGAHIGRTIAELEYFLNNSGKGEPQSLSISEAPVRAYANLLEQTGRLGGRLIFCCIDEYENLLPYQQAILNTYIKHSEPPLSYKVGARLGGLRSRKTIDESDPLATPDDYLEINIAEEHFEHFALSVVRKRLERAAEKGACVSTDAEHVFPSLSRREEARTLGAHESSRQTLARISSECPPDVAKWASQQLPEDLYILAFCAEGERKSLQELATEAAHDDTKWRTRINNYGYASLFWLSKGRRGLRTRKYYCGIRTFAALASGNIRYFLELIDMSLHEHFSDRGDAEGDGNPTAPSPNVVVAPGDQTEAARAVAKRRVDNVEAVGEHGMAIKRLVLGVGKVFHLLARNPEGHAPEITSFVLSGPDDARAELKDPYLYEGVAHQSFVVFPRTKATTPFEMKDDEYRLHPIFTPFFEFSHRKKRRAVLAADALLKLVRPGASDTPNQIIAELLGARILDEDDTPEQLAMFAPFYKGAGNGRH